MSKRKHTTLSLKDKCTIIKRLDNGETRAKLAAEFGVGKSTITDIKTKKDRILSFCSRTESGPGERKTLKSAENPDVEHALYAWIVQQRAKKNFLSGDIIAEKAKFFYQEIMNKDDFRASKGWVDNFKKRFGIRVLTVTGEKLSNNDKAFEDFKIVFQNELEEKELNREQVYNVDESGLFWKSLPKKTLVLAGEKDAPGRKISKERITFFPCSNAAGTHKLRLSVIGKSKNPRCFKNCTLPVKYYNQKSAWMNREIFIDWFHGEFVLAVRNHLKSINLPEKAVLLLDNCPGHPSVDELISDDKQIYAMYLPPNTTALGQPMDQNVICAIKARYKKNLVYSIVASDKHLEAVIKALTIKDAIFSLVKAWSETSQGNIVSSWTKLWPFPQCQMNESVSVASLVPEIVDSLTTAHFREEDNITHSDVSEWLVEEEEEICHENLTDAEIIQRVREEAISDDDDDLEEPTVGIKHSEALQAFNTCLAYADQTNLPFQQLLLLRQMRDDAFRKTIKKSGQKKIQDFFNVQ